MTVRPFDFGALPKVSRAEIAARAQLRAVPTEAMARALERIVGAPVTITTTLARSFAPGHLLAVGVELALVAEPDDPARVDVETALAREVVARALKQPVTTLADPRKTPPAELSGAFAAVLLAALRTSGKPARLVTDLARSDSAVIVFLTVTMAGAAFDARVSFEPRPIAPVVSDLARLGDAPIVLPAVATSCLATRAEIAALEPGDVFLPGIPFMEEWSVDLVAPNEERGLRARVGSDRKLVIRTLPSVHSWDPPMVDESKPIDVALDAPVVVRVEIGSVSMTAREWAALGDGDVVATGVKIGSHAVLRIGGVEVARGEIVNVDGELGVRIVGATKR